MTVTLERAPSIPLLYARTAAPLIPGASLLPFVPGGGGEIPELELELGGVRADPAAVAAYARACGFALRDSLPATYPHVLAFPLHMAVMADGRFPFGAVGLVHLENRIEQHRPLALDEELTLRVRPTPLQPHPKGRTFTIQTIVGDRDGIPAWSGVSTFLRRGTPTSQPTTPSPGTEAWAELDDAPAAATWRLDSGLGRRYASVSGDRNPIHMHALAAKPLGFPAAIAHGMWTKARCLAALESRLPAAFAAEASFRKPILLPARVELVRAEAGGEIAFRVRDAGSGATHLDGLAGPDQPQANTGRKK